MKKYIVHIDVELECGAESAESLKEMLAGLELYKDSCGCDVVYGGYSAQTTGNQRVVSIEEKVRKRKEVPRDAR